MNIPTELQHLAQLAKHHGLESCEVYAETLRYLLACEIRSREPRTTYDLPTIGQMLAAMELEQARIGLRAFWSALLPDAHAPDGFWLVDRRWIVVTPATCAATMARNLADAYAPVRATEAAPTVEEPTP